MFGEELYNLRTKAGLTQELVAKRAGVTREYVSLLESGRSSPTIEVFVRLCQAVGARPGDLITKIEASLSLVRSPPARRQKKL